MTTIYIDVQNAFDYYDTWDFENAGLIFRISCAVNDPCSIFHQFFQCLQAQSTREAILNSCMPKQAISLSSCSFTSALLVGFYQLWFLWNIFAEKIPWDSRFLLQSSVCPNRRYLLCYADSSTNQKTDHEMSSAAGWRLWRKIHTMDEWFPSTKPECRCMNLL